MPTKSIFAFFETLYSIMASSWVCGRAASNVQDTRVFVDLVATSILPRRPFRFDGFNIESPTCGSVLCVRMFVAIPTEVPPCSIPDQLRRVCQRNAIRIEDQMIE